MRRFLCFVILVGLLFVLAAAQPASAQDKQVVMPRRDGEITILPSGNIEVCETWTVQFIGGLFTHGERTIPLNKVEAIQNWQVGEDGQPYQLKSGEAPNTFQVSRGGGEITANWYFPATKDWTRTFDLCYTLVGALRIEEAADEFYWKFIEADRAYPVESTQVRLHLPDTFDASQIETETYLNGKAQGGGYVLDGATVSFNGGPIEPGQEWEIRVRFPHGAVSAAPPAWQTGASSTSKQLVPLRATTVLSALILGMIIALVGLVIYFGRRYKDSEPESLLGQSLKRMYGWPLIVLGLVIFMGGGVIASSLALPLALTLSFACVGMITFLMGGIARGRVGGWSSGGGDWGGGGDFGGGDGGGGGDSGFG